jgi:hypothetical protein
MSYTSSLLTYPLTKNQSQRVLLKYKKSRQLHKMNIALKYEEKIKQKGIPQIDKPRAV